MPGNEQREVEMEKREGRHNPYLLRRILRWSAGIIAAGILLLLLLFIVVSKYPSVGAGGAEWLRGIIGDKAVAGLEMVVFQIQDSFQMLKYKLGLENPTADWASLPSPSANPTSPPGTDTPHILLSLRPPIGPAQFNLLRPRPSPGSRLQFLL